jgi:hypothetical protein
MVQYQGDSMKKHLTFHTYYSNQLTTFRRKKTFRLTLLRFGNRALQETISIIKKTFKHNLSKSHALLVSNHFFLIILPRLMSSVDRHLH